MTAPALLTTSEYARRHRVPLRTVQLWAKNGRLSAIRPGREWLIYPDDLPPRQEIT